MALLLISLCIAGLLGVATGAWAARAGARRAKDAPSSPFAKRLRSARWPGFALGIASWPLTGVMSYPYPDNAGRVGRIAGIPFPAAYFDPEGMDYVGVITLVAVIGNTIFWALLPRLVVVGLAFVQERRAHTVA